MGIMNIHILTEPQGNHAALQVQAALAAALVADHRQGKHTYGNMRRDCPMCQARK